MGHTAAKKLKAQENKNLKRIYKKKKWICGYPTWPFKQWAH